MYISWIYCRVLYPSYAFHLHKTESIFLLMANDSLSQLEKTSQMHTWLLNSDFKKFRSMNYVHGWCQAGYWPGNFGVRGSLAMTLIYLPAFSGSRSDRSHCRWSGEYKAPGHKQLQCQRRDSWYNVLSYQYEYFITTIHLSQTGK